LALVKDIRLILDNYHYRSQIIASSIRSPMHIINCAKMGVDVVTSPLDSILRLLKHPLTDSGLEKFLKDAETFNK
jgi:transaldolase